MDFGHGYKSSLKKDRKMLLRFCFLIFALNFFSCSTKRPEGKTEAEILMKEAQILLDKSSYLLATEKLNQIRSKYPYSYYATHAELLQAEILFKQENYIESASAYILFKDFHPKHKDMAYILWMIGESYYKQLPSTFDRDLAPGIEAIKYYKELIALFPNHKKQKDAQDRINFVKKQLQLKEKYIADFYFKTKDYQSARHRYLNILENFQQKQLKEHAMVQVLLSSYYLGKKNDCLKYYHLYKRDIPKETIPLFETTYTNCQSHE